MTPLRFLAFLLLSCLVVAVPAWGHPGHGSTDPDSAGHYLIEVPHALWVIPAVIGAGLIARLLIRKSAAPRNVFVRADERPRN